MQGSSSNKAREEKPEVELERKATQSTKKCLENEGMAFGKEIGDNKVVRRKLEQNELAKDHTMTSLHYEIGDQDEIINRVAKEERGMKRVQTCRLPRRDWTTCARSSRSSNPLFDSLGKSVEKEKKSKANVEREKRKDENQDTWQRGPGAKSKAKTTQEADLGGARCWGGMGSWVDGPRGQGPDGSDYVSRGQSSTSGPRSRHQLQEEEPRPGEEGPSNEPLDNLVNMVDGQKGDAESTDVALACEHGTRSQAHTLSLSTGGESPNLGG